MATGGGSWRTTCFDSAPALCLGVSTKSCRGPIDGGALCVFSAQLAGDLRCPGRPEWCPPACRTRKGNASSAVRGVQVGPRMHCSKSEAHSYPFPRGPATFLPYGTAPKGEEKQPDVDGSDGLHMPGAASCPGRTRPPLRRRTSRRRRPAAPCRPPSTALSPSFFFFVSLPPSPPRRFR